MLRLLHQEAPAGCSLASETTIGRIPISVINRSLFSPQDVTEHCTRTARDYRNMPPWVHTVVLCTYSGPVLYFVDPALNQYQTSDNAWHRCESAL